MSWREMPSFVFIFVSGKKISKTSISGIRTKILGIKQ
jgi:hypothetical protein